MELCSEDGFKIGSHCCICRFPLAVLCDEHLSKHPMNRLEFHHMHLPLKARMVITSHEIWYRYRQQMYQLYCAWGHLEERDEDFKKFEEQVEAQRLQALSKIEERCKASKQRIATLRDMFKAEVSKAVKETTKHAVEQWTPEPNSLEEFMRNFNNKIPKLIEFVVTDADFKSFPGLIQVTLSSLSQFNEVSADSQEKPLLEELADCKKRISELQAENDDLRCEITRLKERALHADNKPLDGKELLLLNGESEEEELFKTNDFSAISPHLAQFPSEDSAILPLFSSKASRFFKLHTNEFISVASRVEFNCTMFCPITSDFVLCIGGLPATSSVKRLSLSTGDITEQKSMKTPRCYPGVIKHGSSLYVFGGCDGSIPLFASEKGEFSIQVWKQLPDMLYPRYGFSPCYWSKSIYLLDVRTNHNVVEEFDIRRKTFKALPVDVPNALCSFSSVAFIADGEMIVITGDNQMGKWQIDTEMAFRTSSLRMTNSDSGFTSTPPVQHYNLVLWARHSDSAMIKFNLDDCTLTAL